MQVTDTNTIPQGSYNFQQSSNSNSDQSIHAFVEARTSPNGMNMRMEDDNLILACSKPMSSTTCSRPAQTSMLLDLPQELLDGVLFHVRREDLPALSRTCVALRATTLPFLLGNMTLNVNSPQAESLIWTLEATVSESKELAGKIHTLQVQGAWTDSDVLWRILPLTHYLMTLAYTLCIDLTDPELEQDCIDGMYLSRQLSPVKDTLTNLKITYGLVWEDGEWTQEHVVNYCSLKQFSKLRVLDIPFFVLLGFTPDQAPRIADMLPRSLITLEFGEDQWRNGSQLWSGWDVGKALIEFVSAAKWKECTPSLRSLNVNRMFEEPCQPPEPADPGSIEAERFFKCLFEENGLECSVCTFSTERWDEFLEEQPS